MRKHYSVKYNTTFLSTHWTLIMYCMYQDTYSLFLWLSSLWGHDDWFLICSHGFQHLEVMIMDFCCTPDPGNLIQGLELSENFLKYASCWKHQFSLFYIISFFPVCLYWTEKFMAGYNYLYHVVYHGTLSYSVVI